MKLDQLRKIIREEVRAAVKEELQEMLTEAVKIASEPSTPKVQKFNEYKPITQKDISRTWSTGKLNTGTVPLEEMLQQTAANMSRNDYKDIIGAKPPSTAASMATQMGMTESAGPMPGLDISNLDFVNKAKAVLDKSYEKDKSR